MEQRSNKIIVTDFYRNVIRLRKSELIANYVRENYIQHSPMGKDGREGLLEMVEFLKKLPPVEETAPSPIVNIIAEGDYVVAHLELQFMGKHIRVIELFRVQDGLAAEHWDVTEEPTDTNAPVITTDDAINNTASDNRSFIRGLYDKVKGVIIHHIVEEGDQVAVHAELKQGGTSTALFDIFILKGGKITEHHYVKQAVPEKMMHSNGMF